MARRLLCQAIFFCSDRNQNSNTGDFPCLTNDEVETIGKNIAAIEPLVNSFQETIIVSSSAKSAFGFADIIARKLGYNKSIKQEPNLQAGDCRASGTHEHFLAYFAKMIRHSLISLFPQCIIHVCHYENLGCFTEHLFGSEFTKNKPLECGEIIVINVYYIEEQNRIEVRAQFRGEKSSLITFNCKEKAFQ
ncbi:MAG: hypothetical protein AAB352_00270 [Patescibacteria group bacterium]